MGNMKVIKIRPLPPVPGVRQFLAAATQARVLVLGDVMLDHFLWGKVERISPEAPVPIVEFQQESFVPGGAGNVARNLADLNARTELFGVVGDDEAARHLRKILKRERVGCAGLLTCPERVTSIKTRIIAHRQQVVRLDRESRNYVDEDTTRRCSHIGRLRQRRRNPAFARSGAESLPPARRVAERGSQACASLEFVGRFVADAQSQGGL